MLAFKLYRLTLDPAPAIPTLPCLDHEAMLHEGVAPHLAIYIQDGSSDDIHEVVVTPSERRIEEDIVSTWGECSPESRARLLSVVRQRFPNYRVDETTTFLVARRSASGHRVPGAGHAARRPARHTISRA